MLRLHAVEAALRVSCKQVALSNQEPAGSAVAKCLIKVLSLDESSGKSAKNASWDKIYFHQRKFKKSGHGVFCKQKTNCKPRSTDTADL